MTGFNNPLGAVNATLDAGSANAIGSATATNTNALGIPNVYLNTLLALKAFGAEVVPGGSFDVDIHPYASITIQALSHTVIDPLWLRIDTFQGVAGGSTPSSEFLTIPTPPSALSYSAMWKIPVQGSSWRITNLSATTAVIVIYGSNTQVSSAIQMGESYQPRVFARRAVATVENVSQVLLSDDGGPYVTTFNRNIFYSFTAGTIAGQLYLNYISRNGNVKNIFVASCAANTSVTGVLPHPLVPTQWVWLPGATTSGITAIVSIHQNVVA